MAECPICGRAFEPRVGGARGGPRSAPLVDKGSAFPFCSARCKTIDLGKWLSADYRVTVAVEPDDVDRAEAEVQFHTEAGAKS
jgi:endogenous inhibitor of DNA gyrase (YacG/DUF329 family)